jgi:hypothetical protein
MILDECARAISDIRPTFPMKVGRVAKLGCVEIGAYWKHWPCLFPQHGPGPKHERRIDLVPWQADIVRIHAAPLLRGLIHSDGYRGLNWVNGTGFIPAISSAIDLRTFSISSAAPAMTMTSHGGG